MDEARQQLEVHGVSGSRSLECTQLGEELARIYPPTLQWKIILLVKLICCKFKWSYFWRDLFFHFHERKNERSGFILLLIGYDGIPLDLHFFFLTFGPQWLPGVLPSNWCVLLFALVIPCAPFLPSNHTQDLIVASFLVFILFLGFILVTPVANHCHHHIITTRYLIFQIVDYS